MAGSHVPTLRNRSLLTAASHLTSNPAATVTRRYWGTTPARRPVYAYDLTNRRGTRLTAVTLGATIISLQLADRAGVLDDIVLGFDDVDAYLTRSPYFGTVVGRYGNRIAGGRFTLDGETYQLATNNPPNHLHGGRVGFDKHLYAARAVTTADGVGVRFSLTSADGDEGYPGEVHFSVRYLLGDDDTVSIDLQATTTRATPFNPTQHTLLEPRRKAPRRHPRARTRDLRRPVHTGRPDADPDRGAGAGGGDAVRLPHAHRDRRAYRRRR